MNKINLFLLSLEKSLESFLEKTYKVNRFWFYFAFLVILAALLVARRPGLFVDLNFWAEDGMVWFADAYNLGALKTIFIPYGGYFQTICRLTGSLAQLLPLYAGPTFMAITALVINILPAWFLSTKRLQNFFPKIWPRLLLALIIIVLPNSSEYHANISNSPWLLAILALMIFFAAKPKTLAWKIFDYTILALAGLSLPFSVFIAPLALWYAWRKKAEIVYQYRTLVIFLTAGVQILGMFVLSHMSRLLDIPQPSLKIFLGILGKQVFWGGLIGQTGVAWLSFKFTYSFFFFLAFGIIYLLLTAYILWRGPDALKVAVIYSLIILISCLMSPTPHFTSSIRPSWAIIYLTYASRYFVTSIVIFLVSLFWLASKTQPKVLRIIAVSLLATLIIGIPADFNRAKFVPLTVLNYDQSLYKLAELPKGNSLKIPINGHAYGWYMILRKK